MSRLCILLLFMVLSMPLAHADRHKTLPTTPQQVLMEPDMLMRPLQPERALTHSEDIVIRRRRHHMGKRGIDVSHYQGHINWDAVAEDKDANYVYIKATENAGLVDKMFQSNLRGVHKAGIPVGCYHFFSPTASPMAQLKNLTSTVPNLKEHDLVPMIDVEVKPKKTTPEDLRHRLKQFLRGVEDYYGIRPIIYTGQNFYNKYLSGHFEDYLFMIAKYSEGDPELNGNPKFAMWQFTASGRIKGINGAVDQSCFMDSYSLRDIMIKKR